jgi:erythromycin esterase
MTQPPVAHDALARHVTPLGTVDPLVDGDGLRALGDRLADARIVGLGEATHGTREFFEFKHRIVRDLVERHGCQTFAIESAFGSTRRVNDYVQGGDGTAADVVESLRFWTWRTESVCTLLDWLREFNRGRDRDDQVSFWGVDVQSAAGSADRLREYLDAADVAPVDGLDALADEGLPGHGETPDPGELDRARDAVAAVDDALDAHRDALVTATSEREYAVARQHARAIEATVENVDRRPDPDGDDPPTDAQAHRDRAMADRVEWLADNVDGPIALWAHNGHVKRGTMTWLEDDDADVRTLGDHLDERYGDDYHALGFTFRRGAFQAIGDPPDDADQPRGIREFEVDPPDRDSLGKTLGALDHDVAVLDVAGARDDPALADWLDAEDTVRSVGSVYDHDDADDYWKTYDLTGDFDTVVHVDDTTRAHSVGL